MLTFGGSGGSTLETSPTTVSPLDKVAQHDRRQSEKSSDIAAEGSCRINRRRALPTEAICRFF
jgi:hypothetical protein